MLLHSTQLSSLRSITSDESINSSNTRSLKGNESPLPPAYPLRKNKSSTKAKTSASASSSSSPSPSPSPTIKLQQPQQQQPHYPQQSLHESFHSSIGTINSDTRSLEDFSYTLPPRPILKTSSSRKRSKSKKKEEKIRPKLTKSSSLSSLVSGGSSDEDEISTIIPPRRREENHHSMKRSQSSKNVFDSIVDALDEIKVTIDQESCNGSIGEDWRKEVELMKQDFLNKRRAVEESVSKKEGRQSVNNAPEKTRRDEETKNSRRDRGSSFKRTKKGREDSKRKFQQDSQRIKSRMEQTNVQATRSQRNANAKEESTSRHKGGTAKEEDCTIKKEKKDQEGTVDGNSSSKIKRTKPTEKKQGGVPTNANKKKTKPDNITAKPFCVDVSKWKAPSWKKDRKEKALIESAVKYLLNDKTPKATALLIKAFEPVEWKEGKTILQQGETDDHLYIVKNGTVAFQVNNVTVGSGGSGTTFGDQNLLFSSPATVSVVAKEPSKLFRLNQETYRGILQQDHRESFVIEHKPKVKSKVKLSSSVEWWKDSKHDELQKAIQTSLKSIDQDELEKIRVVGDGQFGKVWLVSADICVDIKNNNSSVINNPMSHEFVLKLQSTYDDMREAEAGKAIRREIEAMNDLSRHPFAATLYKTYETKESISMLLGLLPGGELWDVIHQENKATGEWYSGITESAARFYSMIIADTLGYFHSRQYVYRDLKPSNVMIDAVGYPVIIDFGFCKKLPDGVYADKTFTFCGTPDYVSPELIKSRGHNAASDCWTLGVMMFEMISGENPFGEDEMERKQLYRAICKDPPKSLDRKRHSKRARSLIKKLLVKDPACRLRIPDALDHSWFDGLSLEKLRAKKYKAPWIPPAKDIRGIVENEAGENVEQTQKSSVSKKMMDETILEDRNHERPGSTKEVKEPVRRGVETTMAFEEPPKDEIHASNIENSSVDKNRDFCKGKLPSSLLNKALNTSSDGAESTRSSANERGETYSVNALRDDIVHVEKETEELTLEKAKSLLLDIRSEFLIDNDDEESEESSIYMSDDSMDHHNVETKQTELSSFELHLAPGDDISSLEVDDLSYIEEEILPLFDVPTLPVLEAWQRKNAKESQDVEEYLEEAPRTPRDVMNAIAEDAKREHAPRMIPETHKSQYVDIAGAAASLGRLTRLAEHAVEAQGNGSVDRQNKQKIDEWKPTGAPIRLSRSLNDIISIEAAAMGRVSRLKECVTTTSNADWEKSSSSLGMLLDDDEENNIAIEDMVDDEGRRISRADALVDRYVKNLREQLLSQGSQKFTERAMEESEWAINGVTTENVPLPTPKPPKFVVTSKNNHSGDFMANALSREVVERVWDRKMRLNRQKEELRVTSSCHCKYCAKPNPYQTHAYKRMITKAG